MTKKLNSEYTDKKIRDCFIQLLLEKEYDDITISNITKRCEINRTTFYLFYSSKDELLINICDTFLDWYITNLVKYISNMQDNNHKELEKTFDELALKANVLIAMFKIQGSHFNPYIRMQKSIEEAIYSTIKDKYKDENKVNLFSKYYAANAMATVEWWIHNYKNYSSSYVVDIIFLCVNEGVVKILR